MHLETMSFQKAVPDLYGLGQGLANPRRQVAMESWCLGYTAAVLPGFANPGCAD